MSLTAEPAEPGPMLRVTAYVLLAASLVLYVALRIPLIGHLLTWDEAMNVCSVRALASLGNDDFSNWFWRHPPLYATVTMLLGPLREGFIARIEVFNIVLGLINLSLLFLLNRRLFGILTAALSVFLLAVMPGSVFFDMWIKRDHLAVTFALLSLYFISSRRLAYASLCAGLGFLAKETFVFLYIPVVLAALSMPAEKPRFVQRMLLVTVIPFLTSIWWYVLASRGVPLSSIWQHVSFAASGGTAWSGSPFFYISRFLSLMGAGGFLLFAGGVLWAAARIARHQSKPWIWPLSALIIPLIVLSLLPRKVPWLVIVLLPAAATAQAMAFSAALRVLGSYARREATVSAAAIAASALLALPSFTFSYETMLSETAPDQYRGASRSRQIAEAASNLITDTDRILLSSFHYWKGAAPGQMCPVFTCYFKPRPAIMSVGHDAPFELIVQLIVDNELNWAIVSPAPGESARDVLGGFISDARLTPVSTGYACIFNTESLLGEPESGFSDEVSEPAE